MAHTSACRARNELAMAEADYSRWNAATNRIAHSIVDRISAADAPAEEASPATPVLTEEALFVVFFAEDGPGAAATSVEWLPIDVSAEARMDLFNTDAHTAPCHSASTTTTRLIFKCGFFPHLTILQVWGKSHS